MSSPPADQSRYALDQISQANTGTKVLGYFMANWEDILPNRIYTENVKIVWVTRRTLEASQAIDLRSGDG